MSVNEEVIPPYYQYGDHTLKVPRSMHAEHRQKIIQRMKSKSPQNSLILLQGGTDINHYDTDTQYLFRQESFFHYLFGAKEPDFYGAINITTEESFLFVPRLPQSYSVWMGEILQPSYFKKLYEVTHVYYTDEIEKILTDLEISVIYTLKGKNLDSGLITKDATFTGIEKFNVNTTDLHYELCECRLIKSQHEQNVMRYVSRISSEAHTEVMKAIRPGLAEYQMESVFKHYICYYGGCRNCAYTCICASGLNGAVLHYGHAGNPNARTIQDGEMVMFDMGGEYYCYCSDLSRSFPVNGKFTKEQREIYETVLLAQETVLKLLKPGVNWKEMHRLAERVICQRLIEFGFLVGDVDEMIQAFLPNLFMPHGLGHLLGLDTHDVGGYVLGTFRVQEPGLRSLRLGRTLEEGMVLTVEPGIYFNKSIFENEFDNPKYSKFFNKDKIRSFFHFGGVRIEDVVIITHDGCEVITTAPKTVEDIEEVMKNNNK